MLRSQRQEKPSRRRLCDRIGTCCLELSRQYAGGISLAARELSRPRLVGVKMGPIRVAMPGAMGYNRWIPDRSAPLALTTLKSLNAEIKQLEAQKKLVEKRDGEVPKALAVLQKYAKVLSPAQRRQVAKLIGETIDAKPARAAKAAPGPRKGRKLARWRRSIASQPVRRGPVGVWPQGLHRVGQVHRGQGVGSGQPRSEVPVG